MSVERSRNPGRGRQCCEATKKWNILSLRLLRLQWLLPECYSWKKKPHIVEEGLLGVFSIFFIQHFLENTHSCRHKQGKSQHGDTWTGITTKILLWWGQTHNSDMIMSLKEKKKNLFISYNFWSFSQRQKLKDCYSFPPKANNSQLQLIQPMSRTRWTRSTFAK